MQFQQVVKLWLLFMVNLSLVLLYAECEKSRTRVQIRDPDIVLHVQVSSHCCYMQLVQQGVKLWPVVCLTMVIRVGPQVEKSSNLHITADSTGSIHKNASGKKFDPKKVRLRWGDSI